MAHCKRGNGLIKVNGRPLEMIEPRTLQYKVLGLSTGVRVGQLWRQVDISGFPEFVVLGKMRNLVSAMGCLEAELGVERCGAFGDVGRFGGFRGYDKSLRVKTWILKKTGKFGSSLNWVLDGKGFTSLCRLVSCSKLVEGVCHVYNFVSISRVCASGQESVFCSLKRCI